MNNNFIDFGPDSPELEGTTWWKPDGTDHFTVRDLLMSPEGFSVRTTDGRLINGDVFETYIQSDTPINISRQAPVQKIDLSNIDELGGVTVEQPEQPNVSKNLGSLNYEHDVRFKDPAPKRMSPISQPENMELAMIGKVFSKFDDSSIKIIMPEDIMTISSISTITDILNIDKSVIKEYFTQRLQKFINEKSSEIISTWIDNLTGIANGTGQELADEPVDVRPDFETGV